MLFSPGAAWTEGPHQEPATQSADITDMAADAANLSGNDHIFAAFEDFDESAASGEMCTSSFSLNIAAEHNSRVMNSTSWTCTKSHWV